MFHNFLDDSVLNEILDLPRDVVLVPYDVALFNFLELNENDFDFSTKKKNRGEFQTFNMNKKTLMLQYKQSLKRKKATLVSFHLLIGLPILFFWLT